MKALCMRLMHLGLDAHIVGDMTTPPVAEGDLLAGQRRAGMVLDGRCARAVAHATRSAHAGRHRAARRARCPARADVVVHLPAQTMADDRGGEPSLLPMGSLYEAAQLVFFDLVSIMLREQIRPGAGRDARAAHQPGVRVPWTSA